MTKSGKVISDSGPIIHLDELNCLDLLSNFQEIILSKKVSEEIAKYRPLALQRSDLPFTVLSRVMPDDELLNILCRIFSLDAGETEALSLMRQNPESIFLTDDASARLVADQLGHKVHGTIGILIRSIRQRRMNPEDVIRVLSEIPLKSTLHIKHSLLKEIISKVGKEFSID
jgi:predicted nucleic acid-binding protein